MTSAPRGFSRRRGSGTLAGRKPQPRRPARGRAGLIAARAARTRRTGDRLYLLALFALLAILASMTIGPLHSLSAADARVDQLRASRDQLSDRVAELEQRHRSLSDPDHLELLAREKLGMVKPGEIPFVVADADPDPERLRPDGREPEPRKVRRWYQQLGHAFGQLFSGR